MTQPASDQSSRWFSATLQPHPTGRLELVVAIMRSPGHGMDEWADVPGLLAAVEDPENPAVVGSARADVRSGRVLVTRLELRPSAADGRVGVAPPLRYVLSDVANAEPAALDLIAFPAEEDGAVLTPEGARAEGITAADQIAAVRWFPHSGEVDQIYVAPQMRRRKIGTKLLLAAELVCAVQGRSPLQGGGHRTDLGDALLEQSPPSWRNRISPRVTTAPPMTPGE